MHFTLPYHVLQLPNQTLPYHVLQLPNYVLHPALPATKLKPFAVCTVYICTVDMSKYMYNTAYVQYFGPELGFCLEFCSRPNCI